MMKLAECRVGIIGLGLMGGSLALALRDQCRSIAGYDVDANALQQALNLRLIDSPIDLAQPVNAIDLVILAAPVSAILDWLVRLPIVFPGALHVIDLGSTKAQIVTAMQPLPDRFSPLGGHPMCGKETSGLPSADKNLFRDRVFVLTPLDRTSLATLALANEMIKVIGARPFVLEPHRHDRLVAAISHVPYLTSIALIETAARTGDERVWRLAASGFRDSTRLAGSDLRMMIDILISNKQAVLKNIAQTQRSLHELSELIEREDRSGLRTRLISSRTRRQNLVG